MMACPFGVPKYEWAEALPGVRKCTMCADRTSQGLPTACSEICPTGATISGEREELIAEARSRIKAEPEKYLPHILGENELGGTSVLMISGVPFEKFGFKASYAEASLPHLTYRVLSRIPDLTGLGCVFLGGVYWITRRRMQAERGELEDRESNGHEGRN
jgi:formate dehydrogenase iron-sulfur subunit